MSQGGYPSWAPRMLECLGHVLHHPAQLSLAEFSAFHHRDVIFNLDMLTIARTAKLTPPTEKIKAEDEKATTEAEKDAVLNSLSEMCGEMAGADEDLDIENEETSVERTIALHNFDMEELKEMLFRVREVAEGKKKGRKKHTDVQMKLFDDRFHRQLHQEVPESTVKLFEEQMSYSVPQAQAAALQMQEEVLKRLRRQRDEGQEGNAAEEVLDNPFLATAMMHNMSTEEGDRQWIPLPDILLGPAHVAKLLI